MVLYSKRKINKINKHDKNKLSVSRKLREKAIKDAALAGFKEQTSQLFNSIDGAKKNLVSKLGETLEVASGSFIAAKHQYSNR